MSSQTDHSQLPPENSRERAKKLVLSLQDEICNGLESIDGEAKFKEDSWDRPEGGGGKSRLQRQKDFFSKGNPNSKRRIP